jgi:Ca-activated chloride channel family protein
MVVFCTDGFIGNEAEIIAAVEALRGEARVFGFGIGESVNRYLVEGVARAGRGAAEVVSLKDPPDEAVRRLFKRIDRPVLTDLELAFEGAQVTDLEPARLPDLFAGQPLVVAGKVEGGDPTHVRLRGRLGSSAWTARVAIAASAAAQDGSAQPVAGTIWARRRIDALLAERPQGPDRAAIEEAVALALRFKLVTPHTSFVAVEHTVRVDPALPLAQALVPNELPAGVSYAGIFGPASEVEVLPARVKPGDPELRVVAPPDAVAVRVTLPFEDRPREAIRDARRGDFVLRFLVPPGWPEGSYDARIAIVREGGAVLERVAPIRVDRTAAPLTVLAAPAAVRAGEPLRIAVKPALPLARLARLAGQPGGIANALKGAMEVKEVLVRAPWGEVARARMEGPLGAYVAALRVPRGAAPGVARLELVAADAAGNVSRRALDVAIAPPGADAPRLAAAGSAPLALAVVAALVLGLAALAQARGRARRDRLLSIVLGGTLAPRARSSRPPEPPARSGAGSSACPCARRAKLAPALAVGPRGPRRGAGALLLALAVRGAASAAAVAWHERARARHLALPVASDPSLAPAPGVALAELPPCRAEELARVGRRVAAVLGASDGALVVGTFDAGIVRIAPDGGAAAVEGLEGRERFVNALAELDGLVWAATQGGLVALDGERRALGALEGEGVTALTVAHGRLYAGTARGVFRVTAERGAEPLAVTGPDGEPLRVSALAASGARLWIGTPAGAYAVPVANLEAPLLSRTASWHPLVFGAPPAGTNVVTALAAVTGGVVAGTDDGGLVRLGDDGAVTAVRLADAAADQVNPGAAVATAEGVAVGTQGGGLVLATAREAALEVGRPRGLERLAISAVARSGDALLAGTEEGAVVRFSCERPRS